MGASRGARVVELLVTGGATLLLYPACWGLRRAVGLDTAELVAGVLTFHAASVLNDPHFAVTYLLFYRKAHRDVLDPRVSRAQRARVWAVGLVAPVALGAWGGLAIAARSAAALGAMLQLMFALVGWHYVRQGFGVVAALSQRRGLRVDAHTRRALSAHAYAGWALAWANPAAPALELEEKGVVFRALARPAWLEQAAGAAFALTGVAVVVALAARRRRGEPALPLGPLVAFVVSVWSWTIASSWDPVMVYLIPALHSVQYLYFVALREGNRAREAEGPPTFGRPVALKLGALALSSTALGWLLFRGGPALLDAWLVPRGRGVDHGALGPTPYLAATFAFVNLHHYLMDHTLWRRDDPEARYLLGQGSAARSANGQLDGSPTVGSIEIESV